MPFLLFYSLCLLINWITYSIEAIVGSNLGQHRKQCAKIKSKISYDTHIIEVISVTKDYCILSQKLSQSYPKNAKNRALCAQR